MMRTSMLWVGLLVCAFSNSASSEMLEQQPAAGFGYVKTNIKCNTYVNCPIGQSVLVGGVRAIVTVPGLPPMTYCEVGDPQLVCGNTFYKCVLKEVVEGWPEYVCGPAPVANDD
jgi:hypothetical protein